MTPPGSPERARTPSGLSSSERPVTPTAASPSRSRDPSRERDFVRAMKPPESSGIPPARANKDPPKSTGDPGPYRNAQNRQSRAQAPYSRPRSPGPPAPRTTHRPISPNHRQTEYARGPYEQVYPDPSWRQAPWIQPPVHRPQGFAHPSSRSEQSWRQPPSNNWTEFPDPGWSHAPWQAAESGFLKPGATRFPRRQPETQPTFINHRNRDNFAEPSMQKK